MACAYAGGKSQYQSPELGQLKAWERKMRLSEGKEPGRRESPDSVCGHLPKPHTVHAQCRLMATQLMTEDLD